MNKNLGQIKNVNLVTDYLIKTLHMFYRFSNIWDVKQEHMSILTPCQNEATCTDQQGSYFDQCVAPFKDNEH